MVSLSDSMFLFPLDKTKIIFWSMGKTAKQQGQSIDKKKKISFDS